MSARIPGPLFGSLEPPGNTLDVPATGLEIVPVAGIPGQHDIVGSAVRDEVDPDCGYAVRKPEQIRGAAGWRPKVDIGNPDRSVFWRRKRILFR